MYRDTIRASGFTMSRAVLTNICFCRSKGSILSHSVFFPALGYEIVVITHNGVDGYLVRTCVLAQSARMTAVETAALSGV